MPFAACVSFVVIFVVAPNAASAADPFVILSLRSVDELSKDVRAIAGSRSGDASPFDALITQFSGGTGLAGLDRSKPIGICMTLGPALNPQFLAVVPVGDSKAFLGLLGLPPESSQKNEGKTFMVQLFGKQLFTKVSKGYCFFSESREQVERPVNPSCLSGGRSDIAFAVNFSSLPAADRERIGREALGQVERFQDMRSVRTDGPAARLLGERFGRESMRNSLETLFNEADRLLLGLSFDAPSGLFTLDWEMAAKPGTKLAKQYAKLGSSAGSFGNLFSHDAALSIAGKLPFPDEYRKTVDDLVLGNGDKFRAAIDRSAVFANADVRGSAHESLDGLLNAFAGLEELDFALVLESIPGGKATMSAALKVKSGRELLKTIDNAAKFPSAFWEGAKFKHNAAQHGGVRIHSLGIPDKDAGPFAGGPWHFAVRGDAFFITAGTDSLASIKGALEKTGTSGPRRPPFSLKLRPSKLFSILPPPRSMPAARILGAFSGAGDYALVEILPMRDGMKGKVTLGDGFLRLIQAVNGFGPVAGATR